MYGSDTDHDRGAERMSLPRYPEYKPSGVEWLGDVPGHWDVKRLKHNLRLLTQKTDRREHPIALENIESWSGHFVETETEFEGEGIAFERGDILFGKLRPYLAKAYLAEIAGEAVGDFHVMRPSKDVDGRFAQYQILNRDFIAIVDGSTFGAKMPRVSWDFLCNMALTTPPKTEQQTIAAFLDRETGKIDALIAEQQRLVELLAEKRQAVISHAVTKGLTPNVPMKDSGIIWLGEVPAHWEVRRLKRNLRLLTEKTNRRDHTIALENIESWTGRFIPTETEFQGEGIAFDTGDILFGKLRPYLAKAYRAESSGEAVGDFHVMRPVAGINSRFTQYQILNREFIAIVNGSTFGSKMPRASWEFVGGIQVTSPPIIEQQTIATFLDSETAKFDVLTLEAKRATELLQERRSALISAAVTGKIDVRKVA
jgi:type I restriction enzyme S subunit